MKKLIWLISIISTLSIQSINAQNSSGTEFWLAFMENLNLAFNDQPVFAIHIAAQTTTSGTISVPATGFSQDFTVTGGNQIEVLLPNAIWYSEDSEQIEGKGIKITSAAPIEVHATHFRIYFTEATGVLPEEELTDEYLTTCYYQEAGAFPSSFVVVATQDDTAIEITPTAFTLGLHPADIPFSITLNEGEIYQVQALGDLTGSRIKATNGEKIAVFSGAQQAIVGLNCSGAADNHLYEQSQPFNNWSDLYYFVPFKNQGGDLVRILAKDDNTQVYLDCEEIAVLNAGEFFDTNLSNPGVINSTNPISIAQFNDSQDCNASGIGDPNMLQLLPTKNQALFANWRATPGTTGSLAVLTSHFSNVVMKTEDINSIELDGSPIAAFFTPFPADPTQSFAQIPVTLGYHELTSTAPFHTYHYGFGDFDAYTKTGNYQQIIDLEYLCLEIIAEGVFCVDSIINFSANSNFDIVDYNWQTSDGQGSMNESPNFSFPSAGNYTITLEVTTSTGQNFTETYEVTIVSCPNDPCNANPIIEISADEFCAGIDITFTYASTFTFQNVAWDFGDGSTISTQNMPVHVFEPGSYIVNFTGYDAFNCAHSINFPIEIENCSGCGDEELTIEYIGQLCVGEPITFITDIQNPDAFYNWLFSNGGFAFDAQPVITFDTPGTYEVNMSASDIFNNCNYFGNLIIEIEDCDNDCNNLPSLTLEGTTTYCIGETALISANTQANLVDFQWFFNQTNVNINGPDLTFVASQLGISVITLQALDINDCPYEASIDVEIIDCTDPCENYEVINIDVFGVLCVDTILNISTNPPDTNTTYNWQLSNGVTETNPNFSTSFPDTGLQTITLNINNTEGCTDSSIFEIIIEDCTPIDTCLLPPNSVEIIEVTDLPLCQGDSIQWEFFTNEPIDSIFWTTNNGQSSTETAPYFVIPTSGFYDTYLTAYVGNCVFQDTVFGVFYPPCEEICPLYVPNVFSPNGDLINDTIRPLSDCPPNNYVFKVFNRWGSLVFETSDFSEAWDGFFRGKEADIGVYTWIMRYSFSENEMETDSGDFMLVR